MNAALACAVEAVADEAAGRPEMEASRNEAEAAYFGERPLIDREGTPVTTFRAGFERGYMDALKAKRPAPETGCEHGAHPPFTCLQCLADLNR